MSDSEHCKNLYLCQILPSLIKDISLSDRKKIFKSYDKSSESKDIRIFNYKGRGHQYPIREVSGHGRPGFASSSINPWLEYSPNNQNLDRNEYDPSPSVLNNDKNNQNSTNSEDPKDPKQPHKYAFKAETVNHHQQVSLLQKPAHTPLKGTRLRTVKSSTKISRPPLHFPKYIGQKKNAACDDLPFAFSGPVPVSTIREFKKPTFLEKRVLQSVTGMSIDVLENMYLKLKRDQALQKEYSKNSKIVERIKIETKLGKWILSQNKKCNKVSL